MPNISSKITRFKCYCPDTQTHQANCSNWTTKAVCDYNKDFEPSVDVDAFAT